MGVLVGSAFALLLTLPVLDGARDDPRFLLDLMAGLAVGLSIFLMVFTNTEHAPAAGTTLGLVIHTYSWAMPVFVLSSVVILSIIRIVLRPYLRNLL